MMEWAVLAEIIGPLPFFLIAAWAMNHRASNIEAFPSPIPSQQPHWTPTGPRNRGRRSWLATSTTTSHGMPVCPLPQHVRTLDAAKRAGPVSAYHRFFDQKQGSESVPKLYWPGAGAKSCQIDYAFIPDQWLARLRDVSVGTKQDWIDSE